MLDDGGGCNDGVRDCYQMMGDVVIVIYLIMVNNDS